MRVTTQTDNLLIVEERPWVIALFLTLFILIFVGIGLFMVFDGEYWGVLFIVVGGGLGFLFLFLFARRVQVVFNRPEGWVEIRRANLRERYKVRHDLDELSRAIVEESISDGTALFRVTLVIDEGESAGNYPMTSYFSNIGKHHEVAEAINRWLVAAR